MKLSPWGRVHIKEIQIKVDLHNIDSCHHQVSLHSKTQSSFLGFCFVLFFVAFVFVFLLPVITYSQGDLHPDALAPFLAKGSSDPSRLQHQRLHCMQGG